jgi:hypothetical protein
MAGQEKSWFGVKGLFRHVYPDHLGIKARYEESVIVVKAESQEDAHEQALELFQKYANEELGIIFTGHHEVCELSDPVRAGGLLVHAHLPTFSREVHGEILGRRQALLLRRQGLDACLVQSGRKEQRLFQLP